jgi:hypothetical protein
VRASRGVRVATLYPIQERRAMTRAGPFAVAVVLSFGLSVSAQVSNTSDSPRAPTYTPDQLFGPSSPRGSSTDSDSSRESTVTQPLPLRAPTPQPGAPALPCAQATNTSQNASAFPGVSASQLPRAGVNADAFTRPGVSAEQLRALAPGTPASQASSCSPPHDPVLHPDPVNPPRRIPSSIDEQQSPF